MSETTARLYVKNWQKFQHFHNRRPPWIKLYRDTLDDYEFHQLSIEAKAVAFQLWLLASENGAGWFQDDIKVIAFRLRADINVISRALTDLIQRGFFVRVDADNNVISDRYQVDDPETETETETELTALSKIPEIGKPKTKPQNGLHKRQAVEVLEFLNAKTGHRYKPLPANIAPIMARLGEGFTVQDCKSVVAVKRREWQTDEHMAKYLRPATLFNRTNFANYEGQLPRIAEPVQAQLPES